MLQSLKLLHPTTELPSKTGTPPDCPAPGCPVASTFASEVRLVTHLRNRHHPISDDLTSDMGLWRYPTCDKQYMGKSHASTCRS